MPKTRQPYPLEFRQKIVDLVRSGRSLKELAEEFEPSEQTIRNWLAQADADGGKRKDLLSSAEREELVKLRRENNQLKTERVAWNRWVASIHFLLGSSAGGRGQGPRSHTSHRVSPRDPSCVPADSTNHPPSASGFPRAMCGQ